MNYRTVKKSKFHLLTSTLVKDTTHNKILKNSLNFSKYLKKAWKFISKILSNNSEYVYNRNTFYSKSFNYNYTIQDPTDIRLISSTRTFL